jgi:uncharacterized protein (DUF305 family)
VIRARAAALSLAAAGLATLAACGSDDSPGTASPSAAPSATGPSASSAAANTADSTFASTMIVHHQQALEMAKLAPGRSTDPQVLALAKRIEGAQAPEIETMTAWMEQWGMSMSDHSGMDMSQMPGMMSDAELTELSGLKGAAFDRMLLTMMIEHHEGAVSTAETEVSQGANPEAKALAQKIIDDQTAEIAEIRGLLG